MKRVEQWEDKLVEFFKERLKTPFKWGENDCCLFMADSIESITRVDIGEWFRDKYRDRTGAFRLLKQFANGSVTETMDELTTKYGMTETDHSLLSPGDVVLMKANPLDPIAECLSNGVSVGIESFTKGAVLSPGKDGLVLSMKPQVYKAWTL